MTSWIVNTRVDAIDYEGALCSIRAWAQAGLPRYVCIATVNNVMEAYDSREFQRIMNTADLVTPDGMPLVWGLRLLGYKSATRVYGPDLMPLVLEMAEGNGLPVGFYGSTPAVLDGLRQELSKRFPRLEVAYACSPPFRPLTAAEDAQVADDIGRSGAKIVFVGLSTPKQEHWMAAHKGRIHAVMLGVGAAFDFLAGTKPQAPRWMMRIGMEWLFRLITEPRRLGKRYVKHNPRFVVLFALQLLGWRRFSPGALSQS